jgi:hypothetical protein
MSLTFRHHRIDQDMALRRRDQVGRETVGPDIIDVVDDLERLGRLVPRDRHRGEQILERLGLHRAGKRDQRDKCNNKLLHLHPPLLLLGSSENAGCFGAAGIYQYRCS